MEEKIKEILEEYLYADYGGPVHGKDEAIKELSSLLQQRQEVSEDEIQLLAEEFCLKEGYTEVKDLATILKVKRGVLHGFKKCQQLQASDAVLFGEFLSTYCEAGNTDDWMLYDDDGVFVSACNTQELYSGPFQEYKRKKKEE